MKLEDFLNASPVNFLAVATVKQRLLEAGYEEWGAGARCPKIKSGSKVFVTKNDSSIFAFHIGKASMAERGMHIVAAHADSPTFRVKPNAVIRCEGGTVKLNTETYGGAVLSTWMDRPLSLAGRVVLKSRNGDITAPEVRLLRIEQPILTIPNLAIHFNRAVNDGVSLSKQKDMLPILDAGICDEQLTEAEKEHGVLMALVANELDVPAEDILDFDLYLYDTTPAQRIGLHGTLIQSGRLDDLSMVHAGMEALLEESATPEVTKCLAIFDNEETGSQTKQGAGSPFFSSLVKRLLLQQNETGNSSIEAFSRCVEHSFLISADNAHAWHPNYNEKYDPTNHAVMGGGPVIKYNASQKYLSDAVGAAVFKQICREAGVPCQTFVNHSDVAGGSTLGNILSSSFPVRGVDMGNPIWAMHSARETANLKDHEYCIKAFARFFS